MNPHLRNHLVIWTLIALVALMGTSCQTTVCPAYSKGYQKKQNDSFYASKKDPRTEHYKHKEKPSLIEWVWYGR